MLRFARTNTGALQDGQGTGSVLTSLLSFGLVGEVEGLPQEVTQEVKDHHEGHYLKHGERMLHLAARFRSSLRVPHSGQGLRR